MSDCVNEVSYFSSLNGCGIIAQCSSHHLALPLEREAEPMEFQRIQCSPFS